MAPQSPASNRTLYDQGSGLPCCLTGMHYTFTGSTLSLSRLVSSKSREKWLQVDKYGS